MLKRLLPFILLTTGSFWGATNSSALLKMGLAASAQTEVVETGDSEGLYYTFYDQRILLNQRDDQIAVQFTEGSDTRGGIGLQSLPNTV